MAAVRPDMCLVMPVSMASDVEVVSPFHRDLKICVLVERNHMNTLTINGAHQQSVEERFEFRALMRMHMPSFKLILV